MGTKWKELSSGFTMLEVLAALLAIGIIVPAIFGVLMVINQNTTRIEMEQNTMDVLQSAIEEIKTIELEEGPYELKDYLYSGYDVIYNVSGSEKGDTLYLIDIEVKFEGSIIKEYSLYLSERGI